MLAVSIPAISVAIMTTHQKPKSVSSRTAMLYDLMLFESGKKSTSFCILGCVHVLQESNCKI